MKPYLIFLSLIAIFSPLIAETRTNDFSKIDVCNDVGLTLTLMSHARNGGFPHEKMIKLLLNNIPDKKRRGFLLNASVKIYYHWESDKKIISNIVKKCERQQGDLKW
jgi:hypothetical protein